MFRVDLIALIMFEFESLAASLDEGVKSCPSKSICKSGESVGPAAGLFQLHQRFSQTPESSSFGSDADDADSVETPAPETPALETPAPETPAPVTPAPETPAPETPAPETPAPGTPAPETPAPPADATPAPLAGAQFEEPARVDASNHFDMYLASSRLQFLDVDTYTRAFGLTESTAAVPGPTIVVKPGGWINFTLRNVLTDDDPDACDGNTYCMLNHTNFHVHGLHVSSRDHMDNVFEEVMYSTNFQVNIRLPSYHMGGTHWYHTHHHHSTACQAGGGALGAIIVEDPPNSLPNEIANMESKLFVIVHVEPNPGAPATGNVGIEAEGNNFVGTGTGKGAGTGNTDWQTGGTSQMWRTTADSSYVLVNGQYQPAETLEPGAWYRFRLLYAAIRETLEVKLQSTTEGVQCEMKLLAKDGVYLLESLRSIEVAYLAPGSRADVAVRCSCSLATNCGVSLVSQHDDGAFSNTVDIFSDGSANAVTTLEGTLVTFTVPPGSDATNDLSKFRVRRPCYLVDLRNAQVEAGDQMTLELHGPPDNCVTKCAGLPPDQTACTTCERFEHPCESESDRPPMDEDQTGFDATCSPPLSEIALGRVHRWWIGGDSSESATGNEGIAAHPFHIHISPYQIERLDQENATVAQISDNYFWEGDFHDVFLWGGLNDATTFTGHWMQVLFQATKFNGTYVMHCHILEHEDAGMMSYLRVRGTEGSPYDDYAGSDYYQAHLLDDTCYYTGDQLTQNISHDGSTSVPPFWV